MYKGQEMPVNKFELPWSAWFEKRTLVIKVSENWSVDYFNIQESQPVTKEGLMVEVKKLLDAIKEKRPAQISLAVDDLTRPLNYSSFLSQLMEGIAVLNPIPKVVIIIGLGTHAPLTFDELNYKLGKEVFKYDFVEVVNHDHENDVTDAGVQWGKIPVKINKYFIWSDFRVILSTVVPHPFAGFSGGAKMILPGLSNAAITQRTHQMALMGFIGNVGEVKENKFRKIINNLMEHISVHYFIGFLSDSKNECIFLKGGPLKETYLEVTTRAKNLYSIKVPDKQYDIIWLNAFPKDTELLQIDNAFLPIITSPKKFWHEKTVFIVSAACRKGLGYHGLFGPGGSLYRLPREKRILKDHPIHFFIPNVSKNEFQMIFWKNYQLHNHLLSLLNKLVFSMDEKIKVAIFPTASIQIVE